MKAINPVLLMLLVLLMVPLTGCMSTDPYEEVRFDPIKYEVVEREVPVTGSIFLAQARSALFEDVIARGVGDIIVVQLAESTNATKSSNTSISKSSDNNIANPVIAGSQRVIGKDNSLEFDLGSDHEFSGGADSAQSNRLQGTIAVTVTGILPSGNLLIEGEKWLKINRGREYIRLRGIIRPIDVSSNNSILSTQIANAEIYYGGKGELARANAPGWVSRLFMSQLWPF